MTVVVLTLVASVLCAISAAGQHRAASRLARPSERPPRWRSVPVVGFAVALLSTPLWLGSWGLDAGGFLLQAAALHLGSLSVVQPLLVATLLFTLPLAAAELRRWPSGPDWLAAATVSAGLALVLGTRSLGEDDRAAATPALVPALWFLGLIVVLLVVAARRRSPSVRAAMLASAAGMLFAVGAAATKLTTAIAAAGGLTAPLTTWPGYILAIATLGSFALQQSAYAAGPLATVMTAVVVVDPLTSYFLGVVGFGEPVPTMGAPLALSAIGMLVLTVGVAVLTRSPLLQRQPDPVPEVVAPVPASAAEPGAGRGTPRVFPAR